MLTVENGREDEAFPVQFELGIAGSFCHFDQIRVATAGSLRSCNPDRVVLKRVVLSGYPVRVHKKKAVVRWMFHNPDDVRWFKPLELWTKHGMRGRIRVNNP